MTTKNGSLALTLSREALREGLAAIAPGVPTRPSLPILGNIRLRATDRGVELSGTDLDVSLITEVAADVQDAGVLTVPAKRLLAIAKELAPSPCHISNGLKDDAVKVECGEASYRLHSLPDAEFPMFPKVDFDGALRIVAGDIQALATQTSFAASREESRPIINGVLWQMEGEVMRFVATNGHRLALSERTVQPATKPMGDIIVPPKALAHILRLFEADEELEVARNEHILGVRSAKSTVFTRLIEGPYPGYRNVIPKDHNREARVDRIAFKPGELHLRANTPDVGDGRDKIPVKFEGDPLVFGVNASYLLDILGSLDSDEIRLLANHGETALVFKPLAPKNRLLYILMPVRIVE